MGKHSGQQIAHGEAICADMAFLLQRSEEGGYADTATNWLHVPSTWSFVAWQDSSLCVNCDTPLTVSHILVYSQHYGEDHHL
jgi:hypothetical protein